MVQSLLKQSLAILGKELRVEWRTREVLYTMVFFGLVIVVIFGFGVFDRRGAADAAPGVLWAAMLLSGTITITRSFEREREGHCLRALALVPKIGWPLYLGKTLANLAFVMVTLLVVTPLTLFVFQLPRLDQAWALAAALALGAVGYTALGTLVGGMLSRVNMRSVLLPLVLFPLTIPLFGVGVVSTRTIMKGAPQESLVRVPRELSPGAPLWLEIDGQRFETDQHQGDAAAAASALRRQLEGSLKATSLGGYLSMAHSESRPHEILLIRPANSPIQLSAGGLMLEERQGTQASGAPMLLILLALDLLLILVAGWLFTRMIDTME